LFVGALLPAQWLADRLNVSRTPINDALAFLHDKGVLQREKNRGYFVARTVDVANPSVRKRLGLMQQDETARAYFAIADDLLKGDLPETVSEVLLKSRYELTSAQLQAVLHRIAQEGWAYKKPGYGWEFSAMLTTPDSLLQSYRLRMALEPAALLEPGYRLDPKVIEQCRAAEQHLLDGGIDTDTPDQLHERGVRFHESLIEASGNPFFIDTIRRVNRVRRLISYRSMQDRQRYQEHCRQHLHLLDLLEAGRQAEAADSLRAHLASTLKNHQKIRKLLKP
jgi:DNA-binding GntR family transcriptional regulator